MSNRARTASSIDKQLSAMQRESRLSSSNKKDYDLLHSTGQSLDEDSSRSSSSNDSIPSPPPQMNLNVSIEEAIDRLGMGVFQYRILVAAGLCFAADSMEVLLLSFLSLVLVSEWNLSGAQAASITSFVFVGALCGTLTLGPMGDVVGRKPVFIATAVIISVFGLATALANNYWSLVILRFMVGFGVGGLTIPFDTLAEFIPQSHRGTNLLLVEYFWTAGTLLTPVAAFLTLGTSWRWFVTVCALPCVLSTVIGYKVVPESPRWLLEIGKHDTALDILRQAVRVNGENPLEVFPAGTQLTLFDSMEQDELAFCRHRRHHGGEHHGSTESVWLALQELFSPVWKRTSLYLWLSWAGLAFCYYGTIMVVTTVFASTSTAKHGGDDPSASAYSFDYGAVLASASAEIVGTTLVLFTIDRVGRVVSQAVAYGAGGICVFFLCWLASSTSSSSSSTTGRSSLIGLAFMARLWFMAASCTTWVSTAELFPTHLRTTGHATCNAIARLGGAVSPLLLVSAVDSGGGGGGRSSFLQTGIVLLVVSLLTAWSTWHLPETAGRAMGRAAVVVPLDHGADGVFRQDQELPLASRMTRPQPPRSGRSPSNVTSTTPNGEVRTTITAIS